MNLGDWWVVGVHMSVVMRQKPVILFPRARAFHTFPSDEALFASSNIRLAGKGGRA